MIPLKKHILFLSLKRSFCISSAYANGFQCTSDNMRDFYFLCFFIAIQEMVFIPSILILVIISLELYNNPVKDPSWDTATCPLRRRKWGHSKGQGLAKVSSHRNEQLVKELDLLASSLWYWPGNNLSRFQNGSQLTGRTLLFLVCFGYSQKHREVQREPGNRWVPGCAAWASPWMLCDAMEEASKKWWSDRCSPK